MVAQKTNNLERSIRNYNAHFTRANLFVELANKTEQGLSNTLFLIATIFLGLTSPLVSDVQSLSEGLKVILFMSWILTVFSIMAGLWQIILNLQFLSSHFRASNEREAIWAEMPVEDGDFRKAVTLSDGIDRIQNQQTPFSALKGQAAFMIAAICLAIVVGGFALFQNNNDNQPNNKHEYSRDRVSKCFPKNKYYIEECRDTNPKYRFE
jgi:hypothetical protein